MINYGTAFSNKIGTWPNVEGKNVSAPALFDGTGFNKTFIDDLWGFNQALMEYGKLTPTEVQESAAVSQRLEAMKHAFGAPGEGVIWWGQVDPATLGHRILLCEGQTVLAADYPELVAACYVGDEKNNTTYYGLCAGAFMKFAASPPNLGHTDYDLSNNGPYFKLPDARGKFLRDLSNGSGHNPMYGNSKLPGFFQAESSLYHQHWLTNESTAEPYLDLDQVVTTAGSVPGGGLLESDTASSITFKTAGLIDASDGDISSRFSTENRPVNVMCRFGIRY